jgi:acetate kinase
MNQGRYLLVFNAGSSSLKFGVFEYSSELRSCVRGALRDIGRSHSILAIGDTEEEVAKVATVADAAALLLDRAADGIGGIRLTKDNVAATGHRVVHGGEFFAAPVRLDSSALQKLESLAHLAPLHNPHSIAVLDFVQSRFPGVPAVAEFDTSFFHDLPDVVQRYAIPAEWTDRSAVRRYGFHGIAHQYMSEQLQARARPAGPGRVVSLQLGQGCSAAAICNGRPVETSMGFTPLEGLVMGTRSGDIDAGVLFYMAQQGCEWRQLERILNRESGLLGLSGASDDIRELLELESQQHAGATLALAVFCHRIVKYLGAYAAVMGGIDSIVFVGGIGENSPVIRARICAGLRWLGLELDDVTNTSCVGGSEKISTDSSSITVHVIRVDEEAIIAAATRVAIRESSESGSAGREFAPLPATGRRSPQER